MIRLAKYEDLNVIMTIYQTARKYMEDNGNPTQWGTAYPSREILEADIQHKYLYVYEENGIIHGAFVFIIGDEPTYQYIENGTWKNNELYGTIHRIASDGAVKGVFNQCLNFCKSQIYNLKIDTHHNNQKMQYLIEKNGFQKCGIIYINDGSPRIGYQYVSH